ncbi:MAG TPA: hypothetical protein PLZ58_01250 [Candidatus Saccharibacteria bacterium]|nr:hypothetical protein [Candidatus Saccharibacteria bacterium]HRQ07054.1 hypothetical protein [Candidatus Saccharibacteria bacterium]
MKSQKKEQGSALHIAIVIILIVIILGLLGYVFYNNFISKPATNASDTTSVDSNNKNQSTPTPDPGYVYFTGGTDYGMPSNVTFEHPIDWQIVSAAHSTFGSVGDDSTGLYHDHGSMYLQTVNTVAGYTAQHGGGQQDNQATIIITVDNRYKSLDDVKTAMYKNDGLATTEGNLTITTHVHSVTFTLGSEPAVAFSQLYTRSNGSNDTKAEYNNTIGDVHDFYVQHNSKVYHIFVNGTTIDKSALQQVMSKLISSWKWL